MANVKSIKGNQNQSFINRTNLCSVDKVDASINNSTQILDENHHIYKMYLRKKLQYLLVDTFLLLSRKLSTDLVN